MLMSSPAPTIDPQFRPALRRDLTCLTEEDGQPHTLWDPICLREVTLGAVSRHLVAALRGGDALTLPALLAEVAATAQIPEGRVEASFRTLLLLNLIEGAGAEILRSVQAARSGGLAAEPVALPETRFECQSSGDCCQSYSYGPLDPGDRERLAALPIAEAFPDIQGDYIEELQTSEGKTVLFLRSIDDRCIFLLEDCRCGIHAHFGVAAKPNLCRDYPYNVLPTIAGLRLYDRAECSKWAVSSSRGPHVLVDQPLLDRLLGDSYDLAASLEHGVVLLADDLPVDHGHFLPLQDRLCDLVGEGIGTVPQTFAALTRLLCLYVSALRDCPLRPGEPDATVAGLLAVPFSELYESPAPLGDCEAGLLSLCRMSDRFVEMIGPRLKVADTVNTPLMTARVARQFTGVAHIIKLIAGQRLAAVTELPDYYQRVADLRAEDPAIAGLMRRSLRQQIYGGRMLLDRSPLAALVRMALGLLTTYVGARSQTLLRGGDSVSIDDFNFGHTLALRTLRNIEPASICISETDRCWDIAQATCALLSS